MHKLLDIIPALALLLVWLLDRKSTHDEIREARADLLHTIEFIDRMHKRKGQVYTPKLDEEWDLFCREKKAEAHLRRRHFFRLKRKP